VFFRPWTRIRAPRPAARQRSASEPAALGASRDYLDEHIAPELRWERRGRRKFVAIRELERWLERESARVLPEGG
jgi:hypothetical protein